MNFHQVAERITGAETALSELDRIMRADLAADWRRPLRGAVRCLTDAREMLEAESKSPSAMPNVWSDRLKHMQALLKDFAKGLIDQDEFDVSQAVVNAALALEHVADKMAEHGVEAHEGFIQVAEGESSDKPSYTGELPPELGALFSLLRKAKNVKVAHSHEGGNLIGRKNRYSCEECKKSYVTIDREEGVTPFMMMCHATPGCDGRALSSLYGKNGREIDEAPDFEWRKPTEAELPRLCRDAAEHVERGGLVLCKIGGDVMPEFLQADETP